MIASYFLYLHILNIVFFRIHLQIYTRYNLFVHRKKSYQLLICRVAKNLPVLELLNHFIKSSTVPYKRVAHKKNLLYLISFLIVYIFYFIIKMVEHFRNLIPHLVEVRLEMTCIKRIQIYSFY